MLDDLEIILFAIFSFILFMVMLLLGIIGNNIWQNRADIILDVRQKIAAKRTEHRIERFACVRDELPVAKTYALELYNERLERELWERYHPELRGINPYSTHRYHELEARYRYERLRTEWNRLNRSSFSLLIGTPIASHFYLESELPLDLPLNSDAVCPDLGPTAFSLHNPSNYFTNCVTTLF